MCLTCTSIPGCHCIVPSARFTQLVTVIWNCSTAGLRLSVPRGGAGAFAPPAFVGAGADARPRKYTQCVSGSFSGSSYFSGKGCASSAPPEHVSTPCTSRRRRECTHPSHTLNASASLATIVTRR